MTLVDLAVALSALTDAARAGTTSQEALSGGTICITNIGVFGIDAGTPILNPVRRHPRDGGNPLTAVGSTG
jgi:pyruvate dehydrogenase E2 component (dihydrolipoamide acetyltransferase)